MAYPAPSNKARPSCFGKPMLHLFGIRFDNQLQGKSARKLLPDNRTVIGE